MTSLTIWCNAKFNEAVIAELTPANRRASPGVSLRVQKSNLAVGGADPLLAEADIALGEPDPDQIMRLAKLKWVQLTPPATRATTAAMICAAFVLARHGDVTVQPFTPSVCRTHAYMWRWPSPAHPWTTSARATNLARRRTPQLPKPLRPDDRDPRLRRIASAVELLAPYRMNVIGVRRKPVGNEPCRMIQTEPAGGSFRWPIA